MGRAGTLIGFTGASAAGLVAAILLLAPAARGALASEHGEVEDYEHGSTASYESKLYGTVQRMPDNRLGTWVVNNREVTVGKNTRIREEYGTAVKGAYVEVEGVNTGKSFTASKIEVKRARK